MLLRDLLLAFTFNLEFYSYIGNFEEESKRSYVLKCSCNKFQGNIEIYLLGRGCCKPIIVGGKS